jgi:hypothetical protein
MRRQLCLLVSKYLVSGVISVLCITAKIKEGPRRRCGIGASTAGSRRSSRCSHGRRATTPSIDLIRERRLREVRPDRVGAIFHIFIDPVTKREGNLPRIANVVGGPQLRQEPGESNEAFKARVMAIANRLRKQNEQIA